MTDAIQYTIRYEEGRRSNGSVGYTAWVKGMEGTTAEGESPEEAVENLLSFLDQLTEGDAKGAMIVIYEPDFLESSGEDPWAMIDFEPAADAEVDTRSGGGRRFSYDLADNQSGRPRSVGA